MKKYECACGYCFEKEEGAEPLCPLCGKKWEKEEKPVRVSVNWDPLDPDSWFTMTQSLQAPKIFPPFWESVDICSFEKVRALCFNNEKRFLRHFSHILYLWDFEARRDMTALYIDYRFVSSILTPFNPDIVCLDGHQSFLALKEIAHFSILKNGYGENWNFLGVIKEE